MGGPIYSFDNTIKLTVTILSIIMVIILCIEGMFKVLFRR